MLLGTSSLGGHKLDRDGSRVSQSKVTLSSVPKRAFK